MKRRRHVVITLLLALSVTGGLLAMSSRSTQAGMSEGRLRRCGSRPNCVCSEIPGQPYSVEPLAIGGDPDAAFRSLVGFLQQQPRVAIERSDDTYVHSVFKTRWLRFRDDVEFRLDREAGVIQVRSAARVGFYDLGKNRSRVEWIRRSWGGGAPAERPSGVSR